MEETKPGKKKALLYTLSFAVIATIFISLLVMLSDWPLHYIAKSRSGYNTNGYRGEKLGAKGPGEIRIASFGGSTTYGYGVSWDETWPFYLEQLLADSDKSHIYKVANIGANMQGIYGINYDVKAYDAIIDYDLAILYNGYNDMPPVGLNKKNFRGDSYIFRKTHYLPIIPLYLEALSMRFKYGWSRESVDKGYENSDASGQGKLMFEIGNSLQSLNAIFSKVNKALIDYDDKAQNLDELNKDTSYREYLTKLEETFQWLVSHNKKVLFVCQPGIYDTVQQKAVRQLIQDKFPRQVAYVNLSDAVDMSDKSLVLDGMHLTSKGNFMLAKVMLQNTRPHLSDAV